MNKNKTKTDTVIVREVHRIVDPTPLANTIYKNFEYLANEPNLGHNIPEINRLLTDENFMGLFVYNSDNNVIAYLVGEIKHLNDGRVVYYISYFFVCPRYQNKKIGSRLISLLISKCENKGNKFIVLTCDTNDKKLVQFYVNRGFVVDPILKNGQRHEIYTYYL
jgi:GNAT superfamily N-acetyltransferase